MSQYEALAEEILNHIAFATGSGAALHIERKALRDMIALIRPSLLEELERSKDPLDPDDPDPGEPRWDVRKRFILAGYQTIGRLASLIAAEGGSVMIETDHLKKAYGIVRQKYAQQPGPYCPDWD